MSQTKLLFDIIKKRTQIKQRQLIITEREINRTLTETAELEQINKLKITLNTNCIVFSGEVSEKGLRYKYTSTMALIAADLNSQNKFIQFRQVSDKVMPVGFAANTLRFAPSVLSFTIPGGVLLKIALKKIINELTTNFVEGVVNHDLETAIQREDDLWTVSIPEDHLPTIMKTPLKLPFLKPCYILGDLLIINKLRIS